MSARRSVVAPIAVVAIAVATGGWLLQQGVDRTENVYVQVRLLQEVVDRVEWPLVSRWRLATMFTASLPSRHTRHACCLVCIPDCMTVSLFRISVSII